MLKIKDNIDLKELEKFGYKMIPEGIYAKSLISWTDITGNKTEIFIAIERDRTIKKYEVYSCYNVAFQEKEKHLFKWNIKDLIKADLVEKV